MIYLIAALASADVADFRPAGVTIKSATALADLRSCAADKLRDARYTVEQKDTDSGVELVAGIDGLLGITGGGRKTVALAIDDRGPHRELSVAYRRPFSAKAAKNVLRDIGKHCFRREYFDAAMSDSSLPSPR